MSMDEIDFVFTDDLGQSYRCKTWSGEPWLFYKRGNDWVSYRQIGLHEVELFRSKETR